MAEVRMTPGEAPQMWRLTLTLGKEEKEDQIHHIVTQNLGLDIKPVRVARGPLAYTFNADEKQAAEVLKRIEGAISPKAKPLSLQAYQVTFITKAPIPDEKCRQIQKDFQNRFSVPLEKCRVGFTCTFLAENKAEASSREREMRVWLSPYLAKGAEGPPCSITPGL